MQIFLKFNDNTVHQQNGDGIGIEGGLNDSFAEVTTIENNTITEVGTSLTTNKRNGIVNKRGHIVHIQGNTIGCGVGGTTVEYAVTEQGASSYTGHTYVKNNVFYLIQGAGAVILNKQGSYSENNTFFGNNKNIVWLGTSIPAFGSDSIGSLTGTDYPHKVGNIVGANVYNEAVGSSMVRAFSGNVGTGNKGTFKGLFSSPLLRSLSHTIAEKQQLMDYWQTGLDADGNIGGVATFGYRDFQQDYVADYTTIASANDILGFSYENKIVAKYLDSGSGSFVSEIDLFVFDHGHNDLVVYNYDGNDATAIAIPPTRDDRSYFCGAMNYIIDVILSYNPRARIVFIGHYENDRKQTIYQAQETIMEYWSFNSLKLWDKLGFTQQEVETTGYWQDSETWINSGGSLQTLTMTQIYFQDDLHPDSESTKKLIADNIAPFIKNSF